MGMRSSTTNRRLLPLLLFLLLMLAGVLGLADGFKWDVPAAKEECFSERFDQGSTVMVQYQVISGSSLAIDFTIYAPNSGVAHQKLDTAGDNMAFFPGFAGEYRFCFDNSKSSWAGDKTVDVHLHVNSQRPLNPQAEPVAHAIWQLQRSIDVVRDGQLHFKGRERVQRDLAESTCQWTLMWGMWEACLVLLLALFQVAQLRRLFDAGLVYNSGALVLPLRWAQRLCMGLMALAEGRPRRASRHHQALVVD